MKFKKFGENLVQVIRVTRKKVMIEIPENCVAVIVRKLKGGESENGSSR